MTTNPCPSVAGPDRSVPDRDALTDPNPGHKVSWLMIRRRWRICSRDGQMVGRVSRVIGERDADIFNGIAFRTRLIDRARYVPSEQVARIQDGSITIAVEAGGIAELPVLAHAFRIHRPCQGQSR